MKNFVYLIQTFSKNIKKFLHLSNRENADAIFLTHDKPVKGATFFPNSFWEEGRNRLLELSKAKGKYMYYIFCDDDVVFSKGGWEEFENNLMKFKPAVAVPVFPKTERTPLKLLKFQAFLVNDEQMTAFHYKVVEDGILLPYQARFPHVYYWTVGEIQEILIQNFYSAAAIQFNNTQIINAAHSYAYPDKKMDRFFRQNLREWLAKQFIGGTFKDISHSKKDLPIILWRTFVFVLRHYLGHYFSFHSSYSVTEKKIRKMLLADSEILKQYLTHRQSS